MVVKYPHQYPQTLLQAVPKIQNYAVPEVFGITWFSVSECD